MALYKAAKITNNSTVLYTTGLNFVTFMWRYHSYVPSFPTESIYEPLIIHTYIS